MARKVRSILPIDVTYLVGKRLGILYVNLQLATIPLSPFSLPQSVYRRSHTFLQTVVNDLLMLQKLVRVPF